jgi:hypothetical protein
VQFWTSIRRALFCLYAIAGSVFFPLNGSSYAQNSLPSVAGSASTIRVSSQFVILDAQVENKQTRVPICVRRRCAPGKDTIAETPGIAGYLARIKGPRYFSSDKHERHPDSVNT